MADFHRLPERCGDCRFELLLKGSECSGPRKIAVQHRPAFCIAVPVPYHELVAERSVREKPRGDSERGAAEVGVQADEIKRWMISIAVMTAAVMELVDTSAVNVSLPYIAGNLSATVNEATWVLTSY